MHGLTTEIVQTLHCEFLFIYDKNAKGRAKNQENTHSSKFYRKNRSSINLIEKKRAIIFFLFNIEM